MCDLIIEALTMIVPILAGSRYLFQNNYRSVLLQRQFNFPRTLRYRNQISVDCKKFHLLKRIFPFSNIMNELLQQKTFLTKLKRRYSLWWVTLTYELKQTRQFLRDNSLCVFKSCIAQFEYVLAYRVRRGVQIISLYTRLWDEVALRHFFLQIRRVAYRKSKEFLLGSSVMLFDWKTGRIPEEDLKSHYNELELCKYLKGQLNEEKVCLCDNDRCQLDSIKVDATCWAPFVKQDDLIVWKKEEENHKGLYCYKMYGKYLDVTAKDFLSVFLDTDNRTKWDEHVVQLKIIDSEPSSNSDVIYWETKWPKLFSNRDYVFTRRYLIDESQKVIIVMNRSTNHPDYPVISSKSRVTEYWSYMVIKPTSDFNQPGIEFSLTYFDNPGMSVPSGISGWASRKGMPDYIKRLRIEALKVSEQRAQLEQLAASSVAKEMEGVEEIKNGEKEKEKTKEREPPRGGGENEETVNHQPFQPLERSFETFLTWASFLEKLSIKRV